jgi:hypothetical protein
MKAFPYILSRFFSLLLSLEKKREKEKKTSEEQISMCDK